MNPHADRDHSEQPRRHAEGSVFTPEQIDRLAEAIRQHDHLPGRPDAGTSRGSDAREERTQRYADAIYTTHRAAVGVLRADLIARTVMAVADAEQEVLRAEVERIWDDFKSLAEQVADTRRRAEAAEAIVEQVRALAEDYELVTANDLLAILEGAQTPQTTRQTRDVAPGAPGSASGGTETGEALEGAQGGEEHSEVLDLMQDELVCAGRLREALTVAWDDDQPDMSGQPQRVRSGSFTTRERADRAAAYYVRRGKGGNVQVERRLVTEWEVAD